MLPVDFAALAALAVTYTLLCLVPVFTIVQCGMKKKKTKVEGSKSKEYKPGHLPEFVQPDKQEEDSLHGLDSQRAFPRRDSNKEAKPSADGGGAATDASK
ncbi:hypothetical protein AAVH_12405 [Aphelenchoides avenae]|nr:hypothetical protein AAVH_12405 [Aphelenchus avenae]